ncbi:BrxA/BrxB family bacilliredoxin [Rubrivirga sp.]|uniref:BrxA/BrxB family bacilliredoxin n=1 Tax=Rubrivirga sp. TaxID=1885344 RepID=UPI003B52AB36
MPYPEPLVAPMRAELTRLGVRELRTAADVDALVDEAQSGTTLAIVNSVCGCAAANARPAVALVQSVEPQPDRMVTVFAGQDTEATARLREVLAGIQPSSPSMFLLKDGDPVVAIERRHIEGRSASAIAADLRQAFETFCGDDAAETPDEPLRPDGAAAPSPGLPATFRSIL